MVKVRNVEVANERQNGVKLSVLLTKNRFVRYVEFQIVTYG